MTNEHEDEIDATEEKAKSIGKEIGVEEEQEPEFEIQEEDDERIAKERDAESGHERKEREKLSNREKRQLRKKKVNEKFNAKDEIIRAQQEKLEQFERRLAEVDGRLSGINKAEVDKALNDTASIFAQAERDSLAAFNEGDGMKHLRALQTMKDADDRFKQLRGVKEQLDRAPQHQQAAPQSHSIAKYKADEWMHRNMWYNAENGDYDSEIAKAISADLVKDKYDPASNDFWNELDNRLSKYMPDKFADDEDDEEEEAPVQKQKKRSTPPVNKASGRSDVTGKKTITLPTSLINMYKANGIWDDKVRMKKILADRERIIREQQSAR